MWIKIILVDYHVFILINKIVHFYLWGVNNLNPPVFKPTNKNKIPTQVWEFYFYLSVLVHSHYTHPT